MKLQPILFTVLVIVLAGDVCRGAEAKEKTQLTNEGICRVLVSTVTEDSTTINWLTEKAEVDEIFAWTQDEMVVRAADAQAAQVHSATLTGLKPNAVYHFLVRGPSGRSHLYDFQTLEPLGDEPDFVMAVVADPQFDGEASAGGRCFGRVVADINERKVDFVVFPGDLVDNRNKGHAIEDFTRDVHGYTKAFRAFKNIADGLQMPYYVVPGNHERLNEEGVREAYTRLFGLEKAYYAKDLAGRHFIFLDCVASAGGRPDEQQVQWLVQDLKSSRDKDVFVILHYAVANDPYVFDKGRGVMPDIQKLLEEHGRVRAVYNGHKNVISATIQRGILYVSCPQPSATPGGYLIVRVYPDGLMQTFQNTPQMIPQLGNPKAPATGEILPEQLRWDGAYRWGRQAARNFTWRYGAPVTSTGVK